MQCMDHCIVIAFGQKTPFARHLEKLGMDVCAVGKDLSDVQDDILHDCEAIYWTMASACNIHKRHIVRSLLLSIPTDCTKILDFNLRLLDAGQMGAVKESLRCCNLLKIDEREFTAICQL